MENFSFCKSVVIASFAGLLAYVGIENIECVQDYNSIRTQLEAISQRDPVRANGLAVNTEKRYSRLKTWFTLYNAPRACKEIRRMYPELENAAKEWAEKHSKEFLFDPRACHTFD